MPPLAPPPPAALLLALDAGSPLVSVAVGRGGEVLATASGEIGRASGELLPMVEVALAAARAGREELGGILCLSGPGSFTGLRVGLATALGLRDALGIPAAAMATLPVLAAAAWRGEQGDPPSPVVAAVDAVRGEWFVQTFAPSFPPRGLGEARRIPAGELPELAPARVVGFGVGALIRDLGPAGKGLRPVEPGPLAPAALALAAAVGADWDPDLLTRPLYLRAPALTPQPARRRG